MAFDYPADLQYLDTHEYVRIDGDTVTIGITAFAIDQLGDIVFLDLPDVGSQLEKGQTCGSIESVKAVEDLYAPLTGEVLERNEAAIDAPESLIEDPYVKGWLFKVKLNTPGDLDDAMGVEAYRSLVEGH